MTVLQSEFLKTMQERGFYHQCTNLEGLDALLCRETVTAYSGFDPTGDSLHVGHLIPFLMMRWFEKCGHRAIILAGGVTGLIGDPKGDSESRQLLEEAEVASNIKSICRFFDRLFTKPHIVNNADWLKKLNYIDFLRDYGRHFSINRMLAMESVKQRLERESSFSFLEFNYMILQGYDFLELYRTQKCLLQIAGSDQWGNIIQGVELTRRIAGVEIFGFTAPLLATASGKKMGKSEEGAVWLNADKMSPYHFYQYWRNTDDADVAKHLRIFTELPMAEIHRLDLLQGAELNDAKKILAFEVTKLVHGEEAAQNAADTARKTFEDGMAAEGLPTITIARERLEKGIPAFELFKEAGLAASGGEARRLITGGGARINDIKVESEIESITLSHIANDSIKLSAGKKKHVLVKAGE